MAGWLNGVDDPKPVRAQIAIAAGLVGGNVADLMARLNVSRQAARSWVAAGRIPHRRIEQIAAAVPIHPLALQRLLGLTKPPERNDQ